MIFCVVVPIKLMIKRPDVVRSMKKHCVSDNYPKMAGESPCKIMIKAEMASGSHFFEGCFWQIRIFLLFYFFINKLRAINKH